MRRIARSGLRHLVTVLAVGWTALCLAAALATPGAAASAPGEPPSCTACQAGIRYGTSGYAGAFTVATPTGEVADTFCIESHKWYPDGAHAAGVPADLPDAATWAAFLAPAATPRSDADQAAVSERVGRDLEGVDEKWRAVDQHARSDQLWAAAQATAGPYTLHLDVTAAPAGTTAGTLSVSVVSAAGRVVPALVGLTGTGAGVPAQVASPAAVAVTVPAAGPWTVAATTGALPPTTVLRYAALDPREQSVIGSGPPGTASAAVSGNAARPSHVTLVKLDAVSQEPLAGAVIQVRDAAGNAVASVRTETTPVTVSLPLGEYTAREVRAPVGHLLDDPAPKPFTVTGRGDTIALSWSDHRARPTISTLASAPRTMPGATITDAVTVAGLPDRQPAFELAVTLLGPVAAAADGRCDSLVAAAFDGAAVAARTTTTVTGNGVTVSPALTVPGAPGCYSFTESGTGVLWPGGPTPVSPAAAPGETVQVVAPAIGTVVTAALGAPGDTVADVLTVTGLPAWAGPRTLDVTLSGPVPPAADGSCDPLPADAWAGAPVAGSTTVTVTGNGEVTTPAVTLPAAVGCYSFAERDRAPLWPGGPTLTAPVGRPGESVLVHSPTTSQGRPPTLAATGPDLPVGPLTAAGIALVADGAWLLGWATRRRRPARHLAPA